MTTQEKAKLLIAIKQNPNLAIFRALQELNNKAETLHKEVKSSLQTHLSKLFEDFDEKISLLVDKRTKEDVFGKMEMLKGEKGDNIKGDDGYTPIKGEDYFTEKEKKDLVKEIMGMIRLPKDGEDGVTPKAGIDYPTKKELKEFIKKYVDGIEIPLAKDGYTPKKGVDYFTEKEIKEFVGELNKLIDNKLTPELMKTKLKELPVREEWFDWGHIRNKPRIDNRSEGGGGGGSGNPQHESFAVSSATTTLTVTTPIAAEGFAIWANYNGQGIVRGTHYTVGTDRRTLTLLFNPQDGTSIDIIYIR